MAPLKLIKKNLTDQRVQLILGLSATSGREVLSIVTDMV